MALSLEQTIYFLCVYKLRGPVLRGMMEASTASGESPGKQNECGETTSHTELLPTVALSPRWKNWESAPPNVVISLHCRQTSRCQLSLWSCSCNVMLFICGGKKKRKIKNLFVGFAFAFENQNLSGFVCFLLQDDLANHCAELWKQGSLFIIQVIFPLVLRDVFRNKKKNKHD